MSSRRFSTRLVARVLVAALALTLATALAARPKVCLVLSGGGARGAAHIGVLEVLEELRVPVDCIAGTSLGAVVGAAYANGMTTTEMREMIQGLTTSALYHEKPPRPEQTTRRKLDDRSILFGLELGLTDEGEITIQKGVISGVQLESILRRLARVQGDRKFDDMPIPYRAVATDLVTGKAVVLDAGDLASVTRASLSVPGVIRPAEMGDRLLVDGGLTNNLPVDVARSMGAEIVIAVNLGTSLMKRDEITSLRGVAAQMINILTEQNVRASLASLRPNDILIEPELGHFSSADFDDMAKAVPLGAAAARKVATSLAKLSLAAESYAAHRAAQRQLRRADDRPVAEIRFRPMRHVNEEVAAAQMDTRLNEPLDAETLDRDLRRLFGTGDFEHVGYRILDEAGRRVLEIEAAEKAWGPNYLRFGLGLGTDLQGDTFFNVAASYRRTWLNRLGAEWRTDAQIGSTNRLATELYQPLETRGRVFVAPRAELERRSVDLFADSQRIAHYDIRTANAAFDVGSDLGRWGELRVGVLAGRLDATLDTGPEFLAPRKDSIRQGAVTARAIFDQLDSANFPRHGIAASAHLFASTKQLGADDRYTKWDVDVLGAYSVGRHTLQFAGKAGGTLGDEPLPVYDLFQWGGFLHQSGYATGALLGQRLRFGRGVYIYKLAEQTLFEGVYAGLSLEAGRVDRPLVPGNTSALLKSTAVFIGADTLIGPVYFGYGWAADGNRSAYLYLGRP